jgi:hypothetical protein
VSTPHDPASDPGADDGAPPGSAHLAALRDDVEGVDDLPVAERVAVFERVNEDIADELARLDEV